MKKYEVTCYGNTQTVLADSARIAAENVTKTSCSLFSDEGRRRTYTTSHSGELIIVCEGGR